MNNADFPAMPVTMQFGKEYHAEFNGNGLTKREYFAGLAMQGLISSGNYAADQGMAKEAVDAADCLLWQMEHNK